METYGATDAQTDNAQIPENLKIDDDSLLRKKSVTSNGKSPNKETRGGYPKSVFFILGTEFCERFSYYGMRAILILYLTKWLKFDSDNATGIYHGFIFLCYFSPVIGAIIADGYLGRYRTILYLSIMYGIGNIIMSATAVPPPEWYGPMIALILIGLGTGGIKPCVSAFGADQFRAEQVKERETFFSVFYFMINLGSMMSIILTPILRADVHCFGEECYPLAFGVPAILMIISAVIFVAGGSMYKKIPPTGNLIGRVFKCIFYGIKGKITHPDKRPHWLDHSLGHFEGEFVEEVKRLLKVLVICIPLPLYWALGDQQGSRWTLQAEQLDGTVGVFGRVKPDQLQALNPILILVLIPLFEKLIYPCLDKCRIPNRPLQRMVAGMFLSVLAFIMAGFVQIKINEQFEDPLMPSETGITHYNTLNCSVSLSSSQGNTHLLSLQHSEYKKYSPGNITWSVTSECSPENVTKMFFFQGEKSYRLVVEWQSNGQLNLMQMDDIRRKSKDGSALISAIITDDDIQGVQLVPVSYTGSVTGKSGTLFLTNSSKHLSLEPGSYKVYTLDKGESNLTDWEHMSDISLGIGGIYSLVLYQSNNKNHMKLFTTVEKNTISMFVMVPQYIVITVGEILFSITGLAFAYSQAPKTMKSVIQAAFLLNTAFGNLLVAIISEIRLFSNQATEFFFYAILMMVDIIIFMIITYFYEYVKSVQTSPVEVDDTAGLIDNLEMEDSYKKK